MHKQITLQACSGLLIGALAGCMSESTKAPTAPRAAAAPAPAPAPVTAPAVPQGPNRIAFPADWATGTLYGSVDRYDIKRYVEFYASPGVVAEVRAGRPIPDGARLLIDGHLATFVDTDIDDVIADFLENARHRHIAVELKKTNGSARNLAPAKG